MEFIFIDNTDLVAGRLLNSNWDIDNVARVMQNAIDAQEGALKTIGGAIWPDKLFVCPIVHKFHNTGAYSFEQIEDLNTSLLVKNKGRVRESLKLVALNRGIEILGVLLAPNRSIED